MKLTTHLLAGITFVSTMSASPAQAETNHPIDSYNIVWNSQSKDSSESMPVGGHSIGLNLWVEDGDILFYAQRSGCFDENNEYLKLGRVRLTLDPNPFKDGNSFRQELKLRDGYAKITGTKDGLSTTVDIWVETGRPVVHMNVESSEPVTLHAAYEGWRNDDVVLPDDNKQSRFGCFSYDGYPGEVIRYRDQVSHQGDSVLFYHRNREDKLLFNYICKQQGLDSVKNQLVNTQTGLTFGGLLTGDQFVQAGTGKGIYQNVPHQSWMLTSKAPSRSHTLKLFTHIDQTDTLEDWKRELKKLSSSKVSSDQSAKTKAQDWWNAFWDRSHLIINASEGPESEAWKIGRNYQLFRYQLGCNAYGSYPTKFNGGNFTFDPYLVKNKRLKGKRKPAVTADWRAWGGGSFTAQNQRLLYWPMLKTGDFEMMVPQFEFYRRALPSALTRVKTYWGHEGCLFTEQMENFGLPIAAAWGFSEKGKTRRRRSPKTEHGVLENKWCKYHYNSQLEFSYMILEYHRFTGVDISKYMEFIKQSIRFYDEHYKMRSTQLTGKPLDTNGKLSIYPSTACETYKDAKNPSDVTAGLRACLTSLSKLPESYVSKADKAYYQNLLQRVPEFAYGTTDSGQAIMKPAESWGPITNVECPQFYSLFPFNNFDLCESDPQLFRNTWKHGTFTKGMVVSWHQDGIFFARMGMTPEAVDYNSKKMKSGDYRFPTFWGPGHDWTPDHNWGGTGMLGIQEMLMQSVGDKIHLFPAWPKDWDVEFKLHAPFNTIVEARLKDGQLTLINVSPPERESDIINMLVKKRTVIHKAHQREFIAHSTKFEKQ